MNYENKYLKYKNKYLLLKKQIGGRQILINGFQGADILMINKHNGIDSLVLFEQKNARGPYAQLAGGRCEDTHTSLEDTICAELYEESKKTIRISKRLFEAMTATGKYVDYVGDSKAGIPGLRRCYTCKVPKISSKIFNGNKIILDKLINPRNPRYSKDLVKRLNKYLETFNMIRIPLANIEASLIVGDDGRAREIKDDFGINHHVARFVMIAYIKAKNAGLIVSPFNLIHTREEHNNNIYDNGKGIIEKGLIDIYE
jgi:hypothetical protein